MSLGKKKCLKTDVRPLTVVPHGTNMWDQMTGLCLTTETGLSEFCRASSLWSSAKHWHAKHSCHLFVLCRLRASQQSPYILDPRVRATKICNSIYSFFMVAHRKLLLLIFFAKMLSSTSTYKDPLYIVLPPFLDIRCLRF